MTKPVRIQRKRTKGWKMPENTVYVGRPTKWGNPWTPKNLRVCVIQKGLVSGIKSSRPGTIAECVDAYREDVMSGEIGIRLAEVRRELRGKDLACWCRLCDLHKDGKPLGVECPACDPCHADVLLEIAKCK